MGSSKEKLVGILFNPKKRQVGVIESPSGRKLVSLGNIGPEIFNIMQLEYDYKKRIQNRMKTD
jgi:hypothetical protein